MFFFPCLRMFQLILPFSFQSTKTNNVAKYSWENQDSRSSRLTAKTDQETKNKLTWARHEYLRGLKYGQDHRKGSLSFVVIESVGFGEQKTKSLQLFSYRKLCAKPTLALKMSKPANILQALLRSFCLQISVYVESDRYLAD